MSDYLGVLKKEFNIKPESIADDIKARKDINFFWPNGTQIYCGRQGSGKTLSAVHHVLRLKRRYPRAILVTNLRLKGMKEHRARSASVLKSFLPELDSGTQYIRFNSLDELAVSLVAVNNGKYGVIYLVDEIHTYFNALDSKNIPMYVFTEISQQRKQRKLIIGTSQLFMRLAKPFREQCDSMIVCNTWLNFFTYQRAYDGMTVDQDFNGNLIGERKKTGWFFHTRKIRNAFDTFQKVVSANEQYENVQRVEKVQFVDGKGRGINFKR